MLPDFVSLKHLIDLALVSFDNAQHRRDPLLSLFRVVTQYEGDKLTKYPVGSLPYDSNDNKPVNYSDFVSRYQVSVDRMIEFGHLASIEMIKVVTAQILAQQQQKVVMDLNNSAKETGQTLHVKRIPVEFEDHMAILERLPMSFDESGRPRHLQMLTPAGVQQVDEIIADWLRDDKKRVEYEQLIQRKRQEWDDRESDRKLVD